MAKGKKPPPPPPVDDVDAPPVDDVDAPPVDDVDAPPVDVPAMVHPYVVASGKSLTCRRAIIGEGEPVCAEHVTGGQVTLDALVKAKYVIKN